MEFNSGFKGLNILNQIYRTRSDNQAQFYTQSNKKTNSNQ